MSMVTEVCMPSLCAANMTSSHSSPEHLPGPMRLRTRSEKISPPPPGTVASPASLNRLSTSPTGMLKRRANSPNSGGGKGVNVDGGEFCPDSAEKIFVICDRQVGIHAALHENLRSADGDEFLDLF